MSKEKIENENRSLEIASSLCMDYFSVYLVDLDEDTFKIHRTSDVISSQVATLMEQFQSYSEAVSAYIYTYAYPDDMEFVREETKIENVRKRLQEEEAFSVRYRRIVNGTVEYIEWRYVRIAQEEKNMKAVLAVRNVDEQMKEELQQKALLEDTLNQAREANQAKTSFLSAMSHDIRTPMNAIIGFSEIAITHMDDKEKVMDCLEKILTSSNHLLELINDVLDMSRIESGKATLQEKECSLSQVVHDLVQMVLPQIKAKRIKLFADTFNVRNEDVIADPLKLNQIFLNILGNAVKFTPSGGSIFLQICQMPSEKEEYGSYKFIFKDTGIGMSEEFLEHIFEPFEREKNSVKQGIEGTGLGMSIVKDTVDMMGGTIQIKSAKGQGSEFVIGLDLKLQNNVPKREKIQELEGKRALIVDDDFNTCNSITRMLEQIGVRSEWTTSSRESIFRIQKAREDGDEFQVYIVNWNMPLMDGIETTRKIRRIVGEEAPIIMLTASDWADVENEAKEAGITTFCNKPLFQSDLEKVLLKVNHLAEEKKVPILSTKKQYVGKRVLVTDDNVLNREIAHEILTDAGFLVEGAENGSVAVKMVRQSEEGWYDLVLMDVQMPVMDGHEATKEIRKLSRKDVGTLPIIAMTANAFDEDKELALQSGMNAYITKPLNLEKLFEILSDYI